MEIRRGDVFYADLGNGVGSEQGGVRPVLVIQNNIGNKYSPTVICAAITSQLTKTKLPTHVEITANNYKLDKDSVILCEQIRTLDKKRLAGNLITHIDARKMFEVDKAMAISFGLYNFGSPNVNVA